MARVAVTAFGPDRPGIVAALTGVLMGHGGNLQDTSMTILQGSFAMMLVVEMPPGESPPALEVALGDEVGKLGLSVVVRPLHERSPPAAPGSSWAVSVHGADRPGIVHAVASTLAEQGANVVDLSTRVVGAADALAYVMSLEVVLPVDADPAALERALDEQAAALGVDVHLRPDEADIL